jgi:hypothetical protein
LTTPQLHTTQFQDHHGSSAATSQNPPGLGRRRDDRRATLRQLLDAGHGIKVIVRNASKIPVELQTNERLQGITATSVEHYRILISRRAAVADVDAVVQCLGHTGINKPSASLA